MGIKALIGMALFNTFILSSVFYNVGKGKFIIDYEHPEEMIIHD